MADPDRVRALAEERFGPPLREDQVQLLAAVQAGRVRRFRRDAVRPLSAGEDFVIPAAALLLAGDPDPARLALAIASDARKCTNQLRPFIRRELVTLDVPPEVDQPAPVTSEVWKHSWPWRLTQDGERALARAAPRSRATTRG